MNKYIEVQGEDCSICIELGLVTKYHKRHSREIGLQPRVEAYIQAIILKKTLESISFDRRRVIEEDDGREEAEELVERTVETMTGSGMGTTQETQ